MRSIQTVPEVIKCVDFLLTVPFSDSLSPASGCLYPCATLVGGIIFTPKEFARANVWRGKELLAKQCIPFRTLDDSNGFSQALTY